MTGGLRRGAAIVAAASVFALTPRAAWAEDEHPYTLDDPAYEFSAFYTTGGLVWPGRDHTFVASGLRLHERNGIFGGGILATFLWLPILASGDKSHEYEGSSYGPGYRIDWYRRKSSGERERDRAAARNLLEKLYYHDYQVELDLYLPQAEVSDTRGLGIGIYPLSFGKKRILEVGYRFQYLIDKDDDGTEYKYGFAGIPIRLIFPLGKKLWIKAQIDLGVGWQPKEDDAMDDDDENITVVPVSLEATYSVTNRLFLRASGWTPAGGSAKGEVGATGELGVRF